MRFICNVFANSFAVAGIQDNPSRLFDTDYGHFSFAVFGVEPEEFCKALDIVIAERDNASTYNDYKNSVLGRGFDQITLYRHCNTLSISRAGMKVCYVGDVDSLRGLTKVIRKAEVKYTTELEKELEKEARSYR